jgi:pyruvate ferredoxin oxidoreductase alpha subunit
VIEKVDRDFGERFGRSYDGLFEGYRMEDAELALITLGTTTTTARAVVDELRAQGKKVGLIKLRFMRPFPERELREATKNLKALGVFDRSIAMNRYGPVFTEVRGALSGSGVPLTDHIGGLGGRDLTLEDMRAIYGIIERSVEGSLERSVFWHSLRGEQR